MTAKRRPRPHTTLDREYLSQDTIRELGQEFGPAGPLVFLAIILEAGKQTSGAAGTVELRYRALANLASTDAGTVRAVIAAAIRVDLLADVLEGAERFSARLTRWDIWESKDQTGAKRSAEYRERQAAETS